MTVIRFATFPKTIHQIISTINEGYFFRVGIFNQLFLFQRAVGCSWQFHDFYLLICRREMIFVSEKAVCAVVCVLLVDAGLEVRVLVTWSVTYADFEYLGLFWGAWVRKYLQNTSPIFNLLLNFILKDIFLNNLQNFPQSFLPSKTVMILRYE